MTTHIIHVVVDFESTVHNSDTDRELREIATVIGEAVSAKYESEARPPYFEGVRVVV